MTSQTPRQTLSGVFGEAALKKMIREHVLYFESETQSGELMILEDMKIVDINVTNIVREVYKELTGTYTKRKLKNVVMKNVDFVNCDLESLVFSSSTFTNVRFSETELIAASFVSSQLSGCFFNNLPLSSAAFIESKLIGTSFRSIKGMQVMFNRVTFQRTNIDFSEFPDSSVIECEFEDAAFYSTTFNNATFSNNKFDRGCRFGKTSFLGVDTFKDQILMLGNFGTYNGPIYYFANSSLVFAGCWVGTIDEFEIKYERKFENHILVGNDKTKSDAEYQLAQFNLITAMLRNAEAFYKTMPDVEDCATKYEKFAE